MEIDRFKVLLFEVAHVLAKHGTVIQQTDLSKQVLVTVGDGSAGQSPVPLELASIFAEKLDPLGLGVFCFAEFVPHDGVHRQIIWVFAMQNLSDDAMVRDGAIIGSAGDVETLIVESVDASITSGPCCHALWCTQ